MVRALPPLWCACLPAALATLLAAPRAQTWQETCGRSAAGLVDLHQAARDAGSDALVLLVASHPDDRYLLPAVWLRSAYGCRLAVLLATRGGGAQNSAGPETGDALERIRTLEAEAGCAQLPASVWHLNRPDGGFRRSAAETFAEWGREASLHELVRLVRHIRPDLVLTTHHREEAHGHDLAVVELLPEALRLAADPECSLPGAPHRVARFLLGAGSTVSPRALRIEADQLDRERGTTWRRRAYELLRSAHTSPGAPLPIDSVFGSEMVFEPQGTDPVLPGGARPLGLPSLFDAEVWPGSPARAAELARQLAELPAAVCAATASPGAIVAMMQELRDLRAVQLPGGSAVARIDRRIEALERLLLLLAGVQMTLEVAPGTVAIGGEELPVQLQVHATSPADLALRVAGVGGVEVETGPLELGPSTARATVVVRVPLDASNDPMAPRFRSERFVPPVQLLVSVTVSGTDVTVPLTVPVEQRATVELHVVPHMLLLPTGRREAQFSVGVTRNTRFPIEGELEVGGPAGYALPVDRRPVVLREARSDLFSFDVEAPLQRKPGVDVLRIRLASNRITLPLHTVDVVIAPSLRIGLLRNRDDTLPSVLGVGGLGVDWSDLSDADIATANLRAFDTIVVDVRALRDRLAARRGFRRLLDFAAGRGHRLVVFYQKDVEFHPVGEGFVGAPHAPFQIGRDRVTRADAPVRMLRADHVLLQQPNVIDLGDWDGWEQERALYLPAVWAPAYEELVELQDPGQPPERGALLYARTGEGEYVYCALALSRQLKKLHPGAVRLLANLLTPSPR
jgi:LmbE family N-acetylglucosaminyl deacetylase